MQKLQNVMEMYAEVEDSVCQSLGGFLDAQKAVTKHKVCACSPRTMFVCQPTMEGGVRMRSDPINPALKMSVTVSKLLVPLLLLLCL